MHEDKNKTYHEKFTSFYNSPEWKNLRNQKFYDADGLCELCRKKNIIRQGKEVHHIVPIEEDWNSRLDYDNLILLCPTHHQEMHNRDSQLQQFLRDWENI